MFNNNFFKILLISYFLFLVSALSDCNKLEAANLLNQEAKTYAQKARQFKRRGDIDKAIQYYQKSILLDSANIFVYNELGILYEEKGWLNRAEQMYLKAIRKNPLYLPAHNNLAYLYESEGKINKAIIHWRIRAKLGDSKDKWTKLAKKKLSKYSSDLHIKDRKKIQVANLNKAREYIQKGEKFYIQDKYKQALENFSEAYKLVPENEILKKVVHRVKFELYFNNANISLEKNQYKEALENINKAITLEPHNTEAKNVKKKIVKLLKFKR